jgi:selenocysteine-specific elongation factor
MKHVIIGTAGHVDHGKTALVKALTGIDTDRLEEEKRRGITIELGFAYLDFDDGIRAGIVDVPGHEKFIRNMLAGAGGIDLCMLIVAADEGIMPQTAEHLGILTLLGIKSGVVVITKTDLVDSDWLEMIKQDIARFVKGTFLEGVPVIPVSALTGTGLDLLKNQLRVMIDRVAEKNVRIPFRLPVDRVFPVEGFGTVVTGTLIEGMVHVGDAAEILPSGLQASVRTIQVHGQAAASAGAGQRVALNLSGVKKSDISKGDLVAKRGSVRCATALDVRLDLLPDSTRTVKNAASLHLYHGTRVVLCKASLLDRDELVPGQSCYAQLRLSELLPCKTGDRFVVRFYSPLETIGGGLILDPDPPRHKRRDAAVIGALKIRESGSGGERIYQSAVKAGRLVPSEALRLSLDMPEEEFKLELDALSNTGRLLELLPGRFIADAALDALSASCRTLLQSYHAANPLHTGLRIAELRQKLLGNEETSAANALFGELAREAVLRLESGRASLPEFQIRLTKRQRAIRDKILDVFRAAGYDTIPPEEIAGLFEPKDKNDVAQVTESLLSSGELIMLSKQIYWHRDTFEKARAVAETHFTANRELTMPQFRDLLGASRKYALAMLDYLDSAHVTKKTGDIRTLFKGFGVL